MTVVLFVPRDGSERLVDLANGESLMAGAVKNGIPGIDGECGGCLSCATCHVYVDAEDLSALAPPSDDESAMLDAVTAPRQANSRLGCQIKASDALGALRVHVPQDQS